MKKRLSIILAVLLLVSAFSGFSGPVNEASLFSEPVPGSEYNGYIVKMDDVSADSEDILDDGSFEEIAGAEGLYTCSSDDMEMLLALAGTGDVEYIEPNYEAELFNVNDSAYPQQWNLPVIGAQAAWDLELSGKGVKIAVIDSGLTVSHEDLAGVDIAQGYNIIDKSSNVSDDIGHGTFVSGIIAAVRNNGKGIAGLTDKVTLIPIKCFDNKNTDLSNVISSIYVAVDKYGCDVINLSLGADADTASLREAVDYAVSKGVILVSAVGNSGTPQLFYPAAYDNVVGVGSVGRTGRVSVFSQFNTSVYVVAPGEQLISLTPNNSYNYDQGTSFSTPQVSAMAVMAKHADPDMDVKTFMKLLSDTAVDLGDPGYDNYYGHGLISITDFVKALDYIPDSQKPPAATKEGQDVRLDTVYSENMPPVAVSLDGLFSNPSEQPLSYELFTSTAAGEVSLKGNNMVYSPDYSDQDKNIRVVVKAENDNGSSTSHAVIGISIDSDDISDESSNGFLDMKNHWARKHVAYVVDQEIFRGTGDGIFSPDIYMDRAMFVTALARMSGEDVTGHDCDFTDVSPGSYYYENVSWALDRGIIDEAREFRPNGSITRTEMAVMLHRLAIALELDTDGTADKDVLYGYEDVGSVSKDGLESLTWAVSNALISGRTATTLAPEGVSRRAEVATVILRFSRSFL